MADNRDRWGGRVVFIMAAVGSAVGLGNVWRFPFVAFKNGGGAFLIPYFVAILVAGIPLLILEYGLGQRYQAGAPKALSRVHPWFRWVGWFAMLVGLSISFYYCVIMAYSWKYMIGSVTMAWEQPSSNSDVLKIAFIERKTDTDSEMADLRDQGAKKRKGIPGGCCIEYLKKDEIEGYTEVLKAKYGNNVNILRTKEAVLDFARSYLKSPPDPKADIIPCVVFMHIDNLIKCSESLSEFYSSIDNGRLQSFLKDNPEIDLDKLTVMIPPLKLKPNIFRDKVESAVSEIDPDIIETAKNKRVAKEVSARSILEHDGVKPLGETELEELGVNIENPNDFFRLSGARKVNLISEKENVKNFRNREVLGGFSAGTWMGDHERNQKIDSQVKFLKEEKFTLDALDGGFIIGLSPATLGAYTKLTYDIKNHVSDEKLKADKSELAGALNLLIKSHTSDVFTPVWSLVFWTFITWLCIYLVICKGVHSVGKVVMFTVPAPLVILTILIIHGLLQDGAWKGLRFFLDPNWVMLMDWKVWSAAFGQIFFSLSLGFGIMIAYASFQPKDSDVSNNAFMTTFCNCATSFYGSFAVFSVLGYLAVVTNVDVSDVVEGGPGLVFVTYPLALMKMGHFWGGLTGFLFFSCLLMLGIDSAFSIVEAVVTGIHDSFSKVSRGLLTVIICAVGFLFSSLYCFKSGLIWLDIVDHWVSDGGLMFAGLLECIAISYFLKGGLRGMREHINERSEIQLGNWWDTFIKYVIPAILTVILGMKFIADAETSYSGYDKLYSMANIMVGWGYFVVLFLVAFALAKNWTALIAVFGTTVIMAILFAGLRSIAPAAMGAIGIMFLFGGFAWCLSKAIKGKEPMDSQPEL